jgi:hypothetical protein
MFKQNKAVSESGAPIVATQPPANDVIHNAKVLAFSTKDAVKTPDHSPNEQIRRARELKLILNVVPGRQATELTQAEFSWEEIQDYFKTVNCKQQMTMFEYQNATDKEKKKFKDGMGFIPCSAKVLAGARNQENMAKAYFMVLDIDSKDRNTSLEQVRECIKGYEAIIHSSFSHTHEKPKWRVLLPLMEAIPANEIGKVFDYFQEQFDGHLDSVCGHDPSHFYYTPACPSDAAHLFYYEHLEGELLDAQAILLNHKSSPLAVSAKPALLVPLPVKPVDGVGEGGRNSAGFKLAARLFNNGLEIDEVTAALLNWNEKNDPPMDVVEVHTIVKSAMKKVAKTSSATASRIDEIAVGMNVKYAWVDKQYKVFRHQHRDFISIEALRHISATERIRVRVGDTEKWQTYADVWFCSPKRAEYSDIDFVPGGAAIVDNTINLWKGFGVEPVPGDITLWSAFLDHLFAGDPIARRWFEQWVAYPIQYPGAKLTASVVLWSIIQGVGKSMVGETIGKLYGTHFKTISAAELHGSFNGWLSCVQFILGEENSSSDQRADSNKLKGLITGNTVFVNEKYQPAYELRNCVNFLFTSNDPCAFHLEDSDRRYFVWEISASRLSDEFYDKFIDWRDNLGGMSALMHHFCTLDLTGFNPKGNALVTAAKLEMIHQSKSELEQWQCEVLADEDSVIAVFGKQVSSENEIAEAFNYKHRKRVTSTAARRALRKHHHFASRRVGTRDGRKMLVSLVNHEVWEMADNAAWADEYDKSCATSLRMRL